MAGKNSALALLLVLAASSSAAAQESANAVVSIDYCADQFVLKLLPRERILAVSPDAGEHFSYMRDSAAGLPRVKPRSENIIALQPDLIVRSYGGGPHATGFFNQAGISVLQLPYVSSLADIRNAVMTVAEQLQVPEAGNKIVADMDKRLASLKAASASNTGKSVLYMTPTGVTSGRDTLIHEMLTAAGLSNFQEQPGWRELPLERLAYEQPDLIAAAFFQQDTDHPALWSAMRHPIARQQITTQDTVFLQGAWTACGGWFLIDAIEALAAGSQ